MGSESATNPQRRHGINYEAEGKKVVAVLPHCLWTCRWQFLCSYSHWEVGSNFSPLESGLVWVVYLTNRIQQKSHSQLNHKKSCSFYPGVLEHLLWVSSLLELSCQGLKSPRDTEKLQQVLWTTAPAALSQKWASLPTTNGSHLAHPSQSSLQMTPAPAAVCL